MSAQVSCWEGEGSRILGHHGRERREQGCVWGVWGPPWEAEGPFMSMQVVLSRSGDWTGWKLISAQVRADVLYLSPQFPSTAGELL